MIGQMLPFLSRSIFHNEQPTELNELDAKYDWSRGIKALGIRTHQREHTLYDSS